MIDERDVFEKSFRRYEPEGGSFERLVRRRNRKRRNQRIAAGVVGIAVFLPVVWTVASGLPFMNRSTPAVQGPTETAPPPAPDSAAPATVVRTGTCSDGATWRLEFRPMGDRFKVRFEVQRSPVGHSWRIVLSHVADRMLNAGILKGPETHAVFFRGTRVAAEDGEVVVQQRVWDFIGHDWLRAKAVDRQTGQACRVATEIW